MSKNKLLLSILKKGKVVGARKAPMTNIFFRKVGGEIKVISKHTKVDTNEGTLNVFLQNKGRTIGDMMIDIRNKSHAQTLDTRVDPEFRRKGLSRVMFKNAAEALSRLGKKFFRSGELRSPAQVKIRSKYNTKFIEQYTGRYSEQTRFNISSKDAVNLVSRGKTVQATTRLPLERVRLRGPEGIKGKVIYRRIGGRIVPIRIDK
jgi:predicted GNAT family acetyltransferase